jgi:hypothetical protein
MGTKVTNHGLNSPHIRYASHFDPGWRGGGNALQLSRSGYFTITSPAFERTLRYEKNELEEKKDGAITPIPTGIQANLSKTRNSLAK